MTTSEIGGGSGITAAAEMDGVRVIVIDTSGTARALETGTTLAAAAAGRTIESGDATEANGAVGSLR